MSAVASDFGMPPDATDALFRALLTVSTVAVLLLATGVMQMQLPQRDSAHPRDDSQLVVMMLERREPPPPPPPPLPRPVPKPAVQPRVETPPPAQPAPPVAAPQRVATVRERAQAAGVLAFADMLSDMRESTAPSRLAETEIVQRGVGESARVERRLLATDLSARPASVAVSEFARASGGVALAGRTTTRVDASALQAGSSLPIAAREVRELQDSDPGARGIEDIRRVFDQNKGAIFALYNRVLRSQPGLAGKVVLELVIAPSGKVLECRVVSSELDHEELVDRLVRRVRMFDFGARPVKQTTVTYPVHFLPS